MKALHFRVMSEKNENFEYCQQLVNLDDRERYLISLFAPQKVQNSLWALWAFNQEVAKIRENVSEQMLGEIRLQWWFDALDEIKQGQEREHPVIQALSLSGFSHTIFSLLEESLDARRLDILDGGPADFDGLLTYANGVGGALQEAALRLSLNDKKPTDDAVTVARSVGQAWTMLGLVRALPFHWQSGRSYMPNDATDGMAMPDAEQAFSKLKPIITRMVDFVEAKSVEAIKGRRDLNKGEDITLLNAKLINMHLKSLRLANGNPFELPLHEISDFKKLKGLIAASWFKRYS